MRISDWSSDVCSSDLAVARDPGLGVTVLPAESFRTQFETFVEAPLRKGPFGLLRIDLRIVEDTEGDRIDAELLGHLVDRDLQGHNAGRLAWRAPGISFGQVERSKPPRGPPVRFGLKTDRLGHPTF